MFMNNRRPGLGSNWLLHIAGIAGVYVLGREAGKHHMMHTNCGSSWKKSSTKNETASTPESGH